MMNTVMQQQIENVDEIISRIFEIARKKVEGMKRNILYSKEKEKARAKILYSKIQIRKLRGIQIDEEIMKKDNMKLKWKEQNLS